MYQIRVRTSDSKRPTLPFRYNQALRSVHLTKFVRVIQRHIQYYSAIYS